MVSIYPLRAIQNFALILIFPALPPKNRAPREQKKNTNHRHVLKSPLAALAERSVV